MLFYFKYCNRELLLCFQLTNTNTLQMCTFGVFVCMLLCVCVWISVCSFLHYPILCLCYLLFLNRFVFIMIIHSYLFLTVVRKIIFEFNYRCWLLASIELSHTKIWIFFWPNGKRYAKILYLPLNNIQAYKILCWLVGSFLFQLLSFITVMKMSFFRMIQWMCIRCA